MLSSRFKVLFALGALALGIAGGFLVAQTTGDHHAQRITAAKHIKIGSSGFPSGMLSARTTTAHFRLESYSPHGFTFVTADGKGNPYGGSGTPHVFLNMETQTSAESGGVPRGRTMQIGNSNGTIVTTAHTQFRIRSEDSAWDGDGYSDGLIIGSDQQAFAATGQIWRIVPEAHLEEMTAPVHKHAWKRVNSGGSTLTEYAPGGRNWEIGRGTAASFNFNGGLVNPATGKRPNVAAIFNAKFQALPVTGTCIGGTYPDSGCHFSCPGGGTCSQIGGEAGIYEGYLEHRSNGAADWNRWVPEFGTGVYVAKMRTDGLNAFLEWGADSVMDVSLYRSAENELTLATGDTFVASFHQVAAGGLLTFLPDVSMSRIAANKIGLSSGDTFRADNIEVDAGSLLFGGDASLSRTDANELSLGAGDRLVVEEFEMEGSGMITFGGDVTVSRTAPNTLTLGSGASFVADALTVVGGGAVLFGGDASLSRTDTNELSLAGGDTFVADDIEVNAAGALLFGGDASLSRTDVNELSLAAGDTFVADDIKVNSAGSLLFGGDASLSRTNNDELSLASGDTFVADDIKVNSAGTLLFGGDASLSRTAANELSLAAGDKLISPSIELTPVATEPYACVSGTEGSMYVDTTGGGALCVCIQTVWEFVFDGRGGANCS